MNRSKKIDVWSIKDCIRSCIVVLFYAVLFFLVVYQAIPVHDDLTRLRILNQYQGVRGALLNYYHTWGGRLLPTLAWLLSAKMRLRVWMALNTGFFVVLVFMIPKLTAMNSGGLRRRHTVGIVLAGSLLLLTPVHTMLGSVIWLTGSFYYFWGGACLLIALLPFRDLLFSKETPKPLYILYVFAALYTCYCEQTAAVLIFSGVAGLALLLLRKVRINWKSGFFLLGYYLLIVVNTWICLEAPGSKVRMVNETLRWYPDYDMLSFSDKVFRGIALVANDFLNGAVWILLFISLLVFLLYGKRRRHLSTTEKAISSLPLFLVIVSILPLDMLLSHAVDPSARMGTIVHKFLTNFNIFDYTMVYSRKSYVSFFVALTVLLFLMYLLYAVFEEKKRGLFCVFLYLSALGSGLMICFSPTIYASGSRVFFIPNLLLILVAMCLMDEFLAKFYRSRILTAFCVGTFVVALLLWMAYFVQVKDLIFYL